MSCGGAVGDLGRFVVCWAVPWPNYYLSMFTVSHISSEQGSLVESHKKLVE